MEKYLGKINSVRFGFGGYQDAQFGLMLDFRFDGSMGIATFISGGWRDAPSKGAQWTEADRADSQSKLCMKIIKLLQDAKVYDVTDLKGKPVEIEIENQSLKDWRILKEVL